MGGMLNNQNLINLHKSFYERVNPSIEIMSNPSIYDNRNLAIQHINHFATNTSKLLNILTPGNFIKSFITVSEQRYSEQGAAIIDSDGWYYSNRSPLEKNSPCIGKPSFRLDFNMPASNNGTMERIVSIARISDFARNHFIDNFDINTSYVNNRSVSILMINALEVFKKVKTPVKWGECIKDYNQTVSKLPTIDKNANSNDNPHEHLCLVKLEQGETPRNTLNQLLQHVRDTNTYIHQNKEISANQPQPFTHA